LRSLLGLGLKFIPAPKYTNKWSSLKTSSLSRLHRSLKLRFYFAGKDDETNMDDDDDDKYNPKMYVKSNWDPPPWTYPKKQLEERFALLDEKLNSLFKKRRGKTNLLPHQQCALRQLQQQQDFLIVPCDKNLGPAIIQTEDYMRIAFRDHLSDRNTYRRLKPNEVAIIPVQLTNAVEAWMKEHKQWLSKMERKFIKKELEENKNPFARFYLTLKAHKLKQGQNVQHLKSRPIVSCPGSLLHPLGLWIDRQLQPVAACQPSYFKNSYALREELLQMELPPNAVLFTADATSMYTTIPTNTAMVVIKNLLLNYSSTHNPNYPVKAVIQGLSLVMRNNIFTFGDVTFRQLNGTAMGTPPAPPYATIYYAAHEEGLLQRHQSHLVYYKRFIDDVIGIYLRDPDPTVDEDNWKRLQTDMNGADGLEWEFSKRSQCVDFMDLTVSIQNRRIVTTLFEKPLNLHLYIPPHSAHPPGLLPGIVFGTLFRIFTLCSNPDDRIERTRIFFQRLIARGYKSDKLKPLFYKAIARAKEYVGKPATKSSMDQSVILHLPFHPNDPASYEIQKAWRSCVAEPQYKMKLWNMRNPSKNQKCGVTRMIIAYKRPRNLGNLLSHRNLNDIGPPVSSYCQD
jgi:hypothetical protein